MNVSEIENILSVVCVFGSDQFSDAVQQHDKHRFQSEPLGDGNSEGRAGAGLTNRSDRLLEVLLNEKSAAIRREKCMRQVMSGCCVYIQPICQ